VKPAGSGVDVFAWPVRVYWEDTDAGGIVYYANYLKFMERARTEWLRARGVSQEQLARESGICFTVVDFSVAYRRPARLDDELVVTCEPQPEGRASLHFAQRILRGGLQGELLVEGRARVACLDAKSLHPKPLPDFVLKEIPGMEQVVQLRERP
jgi:acyl-CoA thioester hydrolase